MPKTYGVWILDSEIRYHICHSEKIFQEVGIDTSPENHASFMSLPISLLDTDRKGAAGEPDGQFLLLDVELDEGNEVSCVSERVLKDLGYWKRPNQLEDGTPVIEYLLTSQSGSKTTVLQFQALYKHVPVLGRAAWVILLNDED